MDMYRLGLDTVIWLQSNLSSLEPLFLLFSHFGDPRNAFLLIFPICYGLHKQIGIKCLWIAALTEWINALLKWIFRDDRPYWYAGNHSTSSDHTILQFPITCETGPGFPSGHVMSICAVGLLILLELNTYITHHNPSMITSKVVLKFTFKLIFLCTFAMVAISRVYIATHFPHQVIFAFLIGALITLIINRLNETIDLSDVRLCFCISFGILFTALMLHQGLVWLNLDPSGTVLLARKWCKKQQWVHLDTTPFYAIIRDSAVIGGLGLGKLLSRLVVLPPFPFKILSIITSVFFLHAVESISILQQSQFIFYALAFCKLVLVSLIVTFFSPLLLSYVYRSVTLQKFDDKCK